MQHEGIEETCVSTMNRCRFPRLQKPFLCVLEERHHEAVPLLPVALVQQDQRFVNQPGKQLQEVIPVDRFANADVLCCLERPTA